MRRLYFSLGKNKFWEYVLLALFLLFFYGPLMNMLLLSFAGDYEYPDVIPRSYGFKWWDYVLSKAQLVQSIGTSLVLAVVVTLLSLAVCLPAAYALARYPFRGRSAVRLSFLLTNAFPKMGIYTAMAVIFYKLNLIGTFAGVVLVHIVNTMMFMVWIPSGAFRTVHIQQEESARDVGASPLRTFLMVTLPMAKPGIIVASLYTFLGSMEEAQGSLLIGLPNVHTMPSELYGIIMSFPDTGGAVFAMILLVPSILLLVVSNAFMTLAWYGHIAFKSRLERFGIMAIVLLSWGIALFEYCFQVPANRIGSAEFGGPFSIWELKVIQEVVSLSVFTVFALVFMKSDTLRWNHLAGFLCLILAVYFIFRK